MLNVVSVFSPKWLNSITMALRDVTAVVMSGGLLPQEPLLNFVHGMSITSFVVCAGIIKRGCASLPSSVPKVLMANSFVDEYFGRLV